MQYDCFLRPIGTNNLAADKSEASRRLAQRTADLQHLLTAAVDTSPTSERHRHTPEGQLRS